METMDLNKSNSPSNSTNSMNQEETSTEPRKNEAEVDARIAKIRARNEALLKRRAEVEADRKSAEEKLASVSIKAQYSEEDEPGKLTESREPMESLFPTKVSPRGNAVADRGSTSVKDRLGDNPSATTRQITQSGRPTRNEKGDGPPPDPGYNFLADRMREEGGDENKEISSDGNWSKVENVQTKDKLGSHRRGFSANTGSFQAGVVQSKGSSGGGWGKQHIEQHIGRPTYGGANRDTIPHSTTASHSRTATRSQNEDGFRNPPANSTKGQGYVDNTSNGGKGFAQSRLERHKQERFGRGVPSSYDREPYHAPHGPRETSVTKKQAGNTGWDDTDWDNGDQNQTDRHSGREKRQGDMDRRNRSSANTDRWNNKNDSTQNVQTWADEDHFSARRNREEQRQPQREKPYTDKNRDRGNAGEWSDKDWDNGDKTKITRNSGSQKKTNEVDLRNKIIEKKAGGKWDDADWDDGETNDKRQDRGNIHKEEHTNNPGARRRAVISDSAESGHAPYDNLKIKVQFDKSPKREPPASKQFDRANEGNVALGAHKRSSFQNKNTYAHASNNTNVPTHSKDKELDNVPYTNKVVQEKRSPAPVLSSPIYTNEGLRGVSASNFPSSSNFGSTGARNISNWQPMPENVQQLPNHSETIRKHQSNSSWTPPPSFQPMHVTTNSGNAMSNIQQDPQEEFTIGEWNVPTTSSSAQVSSEAHQVHQQQDEEDLNKQWLEVSRNWRETSAQSDWAEESDSKQNSPTVEGTGNLQWMPALPNEHNQMINPAEMYVMPPLPGPFVPVHQSNQPYQEYYPYDTTLMQGAAIMSHHQQPLPPPHHQLHNLQQSNLIASIPSAHVIAPLHQIHPQQIHNLATALTQMTPAASHHNVPIMATHAQHGIPYTDATARHPVTYQVQPQYYEGAIPASGEVLPVLGRGRGIYGMNVRRNSFEHGLRKPGQTIGSNNKYNEASSVSQDWRNRDSQDSTANWRNLPDKDVTKIPPRFQKQRPSTTNSAQNLYSKKLAERENTTRRSSLPKAPNRSAPETAIRLTVFGTSDIVNNLDESDMSDSLDGIPVRLITTKNLSDFREKIEMVDPNIDRFVLIHGLGEEARSVAVTNEPGKCSDVDKGSVSDGIASEFSDIVEDLVQRIPYILVAISALLPRFDLEDKVGMSCSNNVRKVMNVDISTRFNDNQSVILINNDLVLEWWKDDVKKMRLFCTDGHNLTAYGFSVMLDNWMVKLKALVSTVEIDEAVLPSDKDSKNGSSSTSPVSFSNPQPCLDRLTEKMSSTELESPTSDMKCNDRKSDTNTEGIELPRISIDNFEAKSCAGSDGKTDSLEVFHDASETMNEATSDKSDSLIDMASAQPTTDVDPTSDSENDSKTSASPLPILSEEKPTVDIISTDDRYTTITDESFTEKANEEIMEKDLPDTTESHESKEKE